MLKKFYCETILDNSHSLVTLLVLVSSWMCPIAWKNMCKFRSTEQKNWHSVANIIIFFFFNKYIPYNFLKENKIIEIPLTLWLIQVFDLKYDSLYLYNIITYYLRHFWTRCSLQNITLNRCVKICIIKLAFKEKKKS